MSIPGRRLRGWQSCLPPPAARKLASLIEALPDAPAILRDLPAPDLPAIAVRLIALLPRSGKPVEAAKANAGAGIDQKAVTRVILINVVLISLAMGIQGFLAWHTQPSHIEPGHAPSAETELPTVEPPIAGQ